MRPKPGLAAADYPRSWTQAQRLRAARGLHPMMGTPFADNGETCGTCKHAWPYRCASTYWKCGLVPFTGGPGSQIRVGWDACTQWEEKPTDDA